MISSFDHAVKREHRDIEAHYQTIVKSSNGDERTRFQNELTWQLARHYVAEELILCPQLEKHLEDGPDIAEKIRERHQSIKNQLNKFQSMKQSDPKFDSHLHAMAKDYEDHIKDEETNYLPRLENAIAVSESRTLAQEFERTKMFLPSRSHPAAPNKPPFETVAGLLAAPIDRLGDIFRKFPKETRIPHPMAQGSRA